MKLLRNQKPIVRTAVLAESTDQVFDAVKKKLYDKLTTEVIPAGHIATQETVITEEDSKLLFQESDSMPR